LSAKAQIQSACDAAPGASYEFCSKFYSEEGEIVALKKIDFMCTAFRDGFQSVYGARVQTQDFLPALEAARDAGISYFEAGGGARYQSLYFYCNEDAFDMMDAFRATAGPDANLQTLARGVNVVGLESQSSDIIQLHATLFKKHGMTTIRNFDALTQDAAA